MSVRWILVTLLVVHGLIHGMGFAKAFGLAELDALTQPVSRRMGLVWMVAGLTLLVSAVLVAREVRIWPWLVLVGVVLSQVAITSSWADARFGTLANLVLLLALILGLARWGPWSLRSEYEAAVSQRLADAAPAARVAQVSEEDLALLPDPVARYLRRVGAVGRPVPTHFRARWRGRIRGGPEEAWMPFEAEQFNFLGQDPARYFFMDARRGGIPVDVLHSYAGGHATMRVRLLSLVPLVRAQGAEMDQAETVTLLNDLILMAAGAVFSPAPEGGLAPGLEWEAVDDTTAQVRYQVGPQDVSALIRFDAQGDLVDFVSDDRLAASPDGETFQALRWSTPVDSYRSHDGVRAFEHARALWHPEEGEPWVYLEGELLELELFPPG